jgi:preprotein translocase subunit SecD
MLDFPRWKTWLVIVSTAFGLILAIPSLMTAAQRAAVLPNWIAKVHINLGLDLSGGSQLLLEADVADGRRRARRFAQGRAEN